MTFNRALHVSFAFAAMVACSSYGAPPPPAPPPLTEAGQKLEAKYADQRKALQAEIVKYLPAVEEQKKADLQAARDVVTQAKADVEAAQQPLSKIAEAKGAVEHAKGKWIGGAENGIAAATAALKKADTDAQRKAAQNELEKWQKNKEDGLKALAERQAVLAAARADEVRCLEVDKAAKAALAAAEAKELQAAMAILAGLDSFLASDKLDAKLVKCAVLAQATPKGLAEFAQQGQEQEELLEKLLADHVLMQQMLEGGGARGGMYGRAMQNYAGIRKASLRSGDGILHRLALGTALVHAVPIKQRNAITETNAPTVVDPVKRYLHYEKAYLDGELDPAFKGMSAWQCRLIVNNEAPDHILAWAREMLRNYRPDHVINPDYGWRYSGAVRTDVAYRHSQEYQDTDSLQFFQNIIKNGGICGRRGFFGRFICKSFGLPTWGVAQDSHCALGRWTPSGWVVNFGAGWEKSWSDGEDPSPIKRKGPDFVLEAQARDLPTDYLKVMRAECVGDMLGEERVDSFKEGSGGFWKAMAYFEKKLIVAGMKSKALAALGTELAEANESVASKASAVVKADVAEADKTIVAGPEGVITIPAAACSGVQSMKSFLGGLQAFSGGPFSCTVDVAHSGKYRLMARVVSVREVGQLQLTVNGAKDPVAITIPYTIGMWQNTGPVEVLLQAGRNELGFAKAASGFTFKEITLMPVAMAK